MKKLLIPLALAYLFSSCKKEDVLIKPKPNEVAMNFAKHPTAIHTYYSEPYNQTKYDSCTKDSVVLSGIESYKIDTFQDSTGYYLRYEIDLTGITGISQRDKTIYKGGGKIVSLVRENFDGTLLKGKTKMRIVYRSNVDKIVLIQNALFIQKDFEVIVQFDSGYIETCK